LLVGFLEMLRKRDFYAGLLMVAFGLVMAVHGPSYSLGTLMHMGPGFLPTSLGVILIVLGVAIALPAFLPVLMGALAEFGVGFARRYVEHAEAGMARTAGSSDELGFSSSTAESYEGKHAGDELGERILPEHPQWFAWACILASPLAFIIFGQYLPISGLGPATFTCVFVASLGDRDANWLSSIFLSCLITFFGVVLFHFVLQIPMPVLKIFEWSVL
jgi:hypothetical protein